ncbi:MAG TPA: response regulator [Blastocatellia bacterium]|nr:response regulator [Blastocatellia bacterium]
MARILVVDDESPSGAGVPEVEDSPLIARYLGATHQVTSARSVLGALAWLDRQEFDFVIIDVMRRGLIKALALCRVVKSDPGTSGTKVMIISGVRDLKPKADAAGADAFIVKPFKLDDVEIGIEALSQRSRSSHPVLYGMTVHDAVKAYSMGMLGWARGV